MVVVCHDWPSRQQGTVLLLVLTLVAILQLLAISTLHRVILDTRTAVNREDNVRALHAADAGLILCLRRLVNGHAPVRNWLGEGEPAYWRTPAAFNGLQPAAFSLAISWPDTAKPPQCLIETKPAQLSSLPSPPSLGPTQAKQAIYLVTVRGFGATLEAQAWAQSIVVFDRGAIHYRWRLIVVRPD